MVNEYNKQDIEIYENFLSFDELREISDYVKKIEHWTIQKSTSEHVNEFLMHDVSDNNYFNTKIFNKIQKLLNKSYKIERIYFNGQWPNRNGDLHQDGCEKTALIYISEYYPNWGGFTQFVFSSKKEFIISPIQNRLVIFPGMLIHKGYSFCDQNCPMRISLAYKLN